MFENLFAWMAGIGKALRVFCKCGIPVLLGALNPALVAFGGFWLAGWTLRRPDRRPSSDELAALWCIGFLWAMVGAVVGPTAVVWWVFLALQSGWKRALRVSRNWAPGF